jgi:hypothetical protein
MVMGFSYNNMNKIQANVKLDNMNRSELIKLVERILRENAELRRMLSYVNRMNYCSLY